MPNGGGDLLANKMGESVELFFLAAIEPQRSLRWNIFEHINRMQQKDLVTQIFQKDSFSFSICISFYVIKNKLLNLYFFLGIFESIKKQLRYRDFLKCSFYRNQPRSVNAQANQVSLGFG